MTASTETERVEQSHQDAWYRRAIDERFFEREGFRRLTSWNLDAFRRAVPLTPDLRVLSIGCGLGDYEIVLAREVRELVALDLSPVAIEEAARRARSLGLANLTFEAVSYRACSFANASFDVVYAFGVLHHLSHAERLELLQSVSRWLRPGGYLYVRDPNADGWLRRWLEPWFRRRSTVHSPNEGSLSPRTLVEELRQSGFVVEHLDHVDVVAGPLPWLLRTSAGVVWNLVFAVDRLCLAVPLLRGLSSQFAVTARRTPRGDEGAR